MKQVYERPMMYIEEFVANQAIAECTTNFDYEFDCMVGGRRDTRNVVTDSCLNKAIYLPGGQTAYNPYGTRSHSNHTGGTWASNGKTYTAPDGAIGLLAICATNGSLNSNAWSASGNQLIHASNVRDHNQSTHCQIAPVYSNTNSSIGS